MDIRLYTGIGEKDFNHHTIHAGEYACVSPVVGRGGVDKHGKVKKVADRAQARNSDEGEIS